MKTAADSPKDSLCCKTVATEYGDLRICRRHDGFRYSVVAIHLPGEALPAGRLCHVWEEHAGNTLSSPPTSLTSLEEELRRSFEGEASKDPSLDLIDLDHCYDFQRKVLLRLRDIPRGMTVSYGTLARSIGAPGAARAVGTALARNPFPLVFPCHRVIRVSGEIGQFGGGTSMKESLLRREGVIFSGKGVVSPRCLVAGFRGERLQD